MTHPPRAARGGSVAAEVGPPRLRLGQQPTANLRFPGCCAVPLPRERFEDFDEFDYKIEYWDAATGTAWVAEAPGAIHEGTSRRLPQLADRIALVRGAPILALGSVDLVERDAAGVALRVMQPDEVLYLHPARAILPQRTLNIGEHHLPDVVLEVDHTTDVRPGKLLVYEAWGFPELWVVVPDKTSRRPVGITLHRLTGGRYQPLAASLAFRGWTAAEILAALTEPVPSAQTDRVLERVGRALGARAGTLPEDTPLIRSLNRQAYAAGRAAEQVAAVRGVLAARGIRLAEPLQAGPAPFAGASSEAVMAAAVACADEADFRRRLGLPRG